ncbi:MAG: hypothetical protein DHS20C21_21290 [Gemmatimonadota bacterium]|nr:MAG: hypothetical protein DHS20C21_21290 [Gemmatimonadota bacterium]
MSGTWKPLAIVLFVVLLWNIAMERYPRPPSLTVDPIEVPEEGKKPVLVLEHADVGTWIAVNNNLLRKRTTNKEVIWTGFVMQVGQFPKPQYLLDRIEFYDEDDSMIDWTNLQDEFLWIDIQANWDGKPGPAIEPLGLEPFQFFPNDTDPLDDYEEVVEKTPYPQVKLKEQRFRQLHCEMFHVQAIVTWWQGPSGYTAESFQASQQLDQMWEFCFNGDDEYSISVYKLDHSSDDPSTHRFSPWETLVGKTVKRVEISGVLNDDPDESHAQVPPWWLP